MASLRPSDWFFVLLAILAAVAIVLPIVYNLSLQLTPEQAAEARGRWRAVAPANYDLDYQQRITAAGATQETAFRVCVREGRIAAVLRDTDLVYLLPAARLALGQAPPADGSEGRDVNAMFEHMESMLDRDASGTRRNYATATFDRRDGHPTRYVRRVRGTTDRLEWTVKLTRSP